ncbi:hypothetical protein BDR03DRAFT_946176 [Suillus americanus]|nr:hypothetical protein BDR03DRAFT_946176 [Suillus americanus]
MLDLHRFAYRPGTSTASSCDARISSRSAFSPSTMRISSFVRLWYANNIGLVKLSCNRLSIGEAMSKTILE